MKNSVTTIKLSKLASIYSGFAFKSSELKKFNLKERSVGIPVIKIANIQSKKVLNECIDFLPKELFTNKLQRYLLKQDDILIAMTGAGSVGKIGKMRMQDRNYLVNQRVAIVRVNPNIANPEYVYQVLTDDKYEQLLYSWGLGAGQPNVSSLQIGEISLPLPLLETQHKIASILSTYDDLIENNSRRIQILEEMVQMVYQEWFVKFHFPGYEKVKFVESPLGMIPEGWEIKKLSDVCTLTMGQSPESKFYNEVGEGLPFHQGVTNFGKHFPVTQVYCTIKNRVANPGDILFSVRAPVGRINIAEQPIVIGRGLSAIRSKDNNQMFIYCQLKDKFFEEDIMGGGTIFKSVTKNDMENIQILYPKENLIKTFESKCLPILSQIGVLTKKNICLHKTRDFLLPKLISGQIDVSDLDISM